MAKKAYIPVMKSHLQEQYANYCRKFNVNSFDSDTLIARNNWIAERNKDWCSVVEEFNLNKDIQKAQQLLKKLRNKKNQNSTSTETANQVAHELLLNRKTKVKKNG